MCRGKWSTEEDDALTRAINNQTLGMATINWVEVVRQVPTRSRKQCRERWFNHLAPGLSTQDWSRDEEDLLLRLGNEYPGKWSFISESFQGRSHSKLRAKYITLRRNQQINEALERRNVGDRLQKPERSAKKAKHDVDLGDFRTESLNFIDLGFSFDLTDFVEFSLL